TAAANGIPEAELVSVIVTGAAYAISQLNAVAAAAVDVTQTVTTNYVTNGVRQNWVLPGGRNGGVMGYASGGVLFEAAEAGPELAYFAGGGVALLPTHGLYMA